MANGNPFFIDIETTDVGPLMQGISSFMQQRKAQQYREDAQEAIMKAVQSGDPKAMANVAIKFPEFQQAAQAAFGFTNQASEQAARDAYRRVLTDPTNASQHLDAGIRAVREAGGRPEMMARDFEMMQQNPKAALKNIEAGYASIDPEGYKTLFKQQRGTELPADQRSFENLIKDFTPEEKEAARKIRAGLAPRAVGSAAQTIAGAGTAELIGDTKAVMRQREKFGEMTGASRAKAIDEGFKRIQKIDDGIQNLDKAIEAIDAGASTGALQRFAPSIRASTVALENVRNRLALDVLNAATFGALSEKELEIVKETALPDKLPPDELRQWLVTRKEGERKLRDYYQEQIDHLDQGGTVASFLRMKRRQQEQGATETTATPEGIQQTEVMETPEGVAAQQTQVAPVIPEGATATNPTTGERLIFKNGQWQPAP